VTVRNMPHLDRFGGLALDLEFRWPFHSTALRRRLLSHHPIFPDDDGLANYAGVWVIYPAEGDRSADYVGASPDIAGGRR